MAGFGSKKRRIKACNENKSKAGKRRKRVLKIKAGKKWWPNDNHKKKDGDGIK